MSGDLALGLRITGDGKAAAAAVREVRNETDALANSAGRVNKTFTDSSRAADTLAATTAETSKLNDQQRQLARELVNVGREAVSGNFAQMPAQLGRMAAAGSTATVALIGTSVAVAALMAHGNKIQQALTDLETGIAATGRAGMLSRDQIKSTIEELKLLPSVSRTVAQETVAALSSVPQIGGQMFAQLTGLVGDFSVAAGVAAPAAARLLAKAMADPTAGARGLDAQYNLLTASQLRQIESMQRQGDLLGAQQVLFDALKERMQGLQINGMTPLTKAFNDLGNAWNGLWFDFSNSEAFKTAESRLARMAGWVTAALGGGAKTGTAAAPAAGRGAADVQMDVKSALSSGAAYDGASGQMEKLADASIKAARAMMDLDAAGLKNTDDYRVLERQFVNINGRLGDMASGAALMKERAQSQYNAIKDALDRSQRALEAQWKEGKTGYEDYINSLNAFDVARLDAEIKKQQAELSIAQQAAGRAEAGSQDAKARQAQINALVSSISILEKKYGDLAATHAKAMADYQKALEAMRLGIIMAAYDAQAANTEKANAALGDYNQTASERLQQLQLEADGYAKTSYQKDLDNELMRAKNEYNKASLAIGAESIEQQEKLLRLYKEQQAALPGAVAARDAAKQAHDVAQARIAETKRMGDEMTRLVSDALMRGFDSGKTFLQNFRDAMKHGFETLVLQPVIRPVMTAVAGGVQSLLGFPGVASAAGGGGGAGGLSTMFSGGGGITGLANSLTGGFDSIFQNAGVGMGQQWIADIGNYGFGMPVISGLTMAAMGNVKGGIGSMLGGIAGSYFGPIGTTVGSALGGLLGSALGGGGAGYAENTGYDIQGNIGRGGVSGSVFSNSSNGSDSYRWFQQSIPTLFAQNGIDANAGISALFKQVESLGKLLGADTSKLAGFSGSFGVGGIGLGAGGSIDINQGWQAAMAQVSDQMVKELIPNIKDFSQANETLTQTFIRLGQAVSQSKANEAFTRMSAALSLSDQTTALFAGDLSPLSNKRKLDMLGGQYSTTLAAAQGGDLKSMGALSGIAQNYLQQAHGYYASSGDYTSIFNRVQGDVQDLVTTTLTDQAIQFADMGVSLDQIAANTQNLDERIAKAIASAIQASSEANAAVVRAQTADLVKTMLEQSYIARNAAFTPA